MGHAIGDKVSFYPPAKWPLQGEFSGRVIGICQLDGHKYFLIRVDSNLALYPWPFAVEASHVYLP